VAELIGDIVRTGRRELIRDMNRTLLLNLVRERGVASRAELARVSGLSPSTVTAITASLLRDRFVLEDPAQPITVGPAAVGRPATNLRVNESAGHVVGIKVAPDHLAATITDLAATPLGAASVERGHVDQPADVAAQFAALVDRCVVEAGADRESLLGLGIGVPGIVNPVTGRVAASPLVDWGHLDLVGILETSLGLPVHIDNDVNTLTVAEQLFGAGRGFADFVVVTIGLGIGMGIVVRGNIYRGANGGAGEIGHVQAARNGPDCWCGRRGCLEAIAAEPALVREVLASTGRLVKPADLARVASAEPEVAAILERAGRLVGQAIATATTILDPDRVVVSGEGVRLGEHYLAALRAGLAEGATKEVNTEVVIEKWGDEAWARGAATLVLRELFHPAHLRDGDARSAEPAARPTTGSTRQFVRSSLGGH
jgi:predicted NBD/HSP70 family sugar kinase